MQTIGAVNDNVDNIEEKKTFLLNTIEGRMETFKDWPFDKNCSCIPLKMAEAGFFHCPTDQEPDLVQCYICFKELDGWEPNDEPWKEHQDHSKSCPLVSLNKKADEMTVAEFLKLEMQRQTIRIRKQGEARIALFKKRAEATRQQMEQLVKI